MSFLFNKLSHLSVLVGARTDQGFHHNLCAIGKVLVRISFGRNIFFCFSEEENRTNCPVWSPPGFKSRHWPLHTQHPSCKYFFIFSPFFFLSTCGESHHVISCFFLFYFFPYNSSLFCFFPTTTNFLRFFIFFVSTSSVSSLSSISRMFDDNDASACCWWSQRFDDDVFWQRILSAKHEPPTNSFLLRTTWVFLFLSPFLWRLLLSY